MWYQKFKKKRILILETERYHYQKVISDISGQDIEIMVNNPKTLITKVRNWFSANFPEDSIAGQSEIWIAYNQFVEDLNTNLTDENYTEEDIQEMPIIDFYKNFSKDWIKNLKIKITHNNQASIAQLGQ